MRFKSVGNKRDIVAVVIRNADTVAIPTGTPVVLSDNSTASVNDGLDVVLPSTAGAAKSDVLFYGICVSPAGYPQNGVPVNGYGESQVFGFNAGLVLVTQTRAASTNSWNSVPSIASFNYLAIDTVANGFDTIGTLAQSGFVPYAVLWQSLASYASSASTTSDTRTAITSSVKGFLRMM